MSLTPPPKVQKLQDTLHAKAKDAPNYRFYALYDKMYRTDVLEFAFRRCRANDGAAGVDGRTFADIEAYGTEAWLGELAEELRTKTYEPDPLRRAYLSKPDGGRRPLGIPTIKDRVVQTAMLLVLEPIFEADLQPEQYAYRPGHSQLDAVRHVHKLVNTGHTEVVDADLSGYFETIPHAELLKSVARRVSDGQVLHLIKLWLQAPVDEIDHRGRRHRTTRNRDEGRGTSQGSPISPLFSNIYMRRFLLGWKTLGYEQRLGAKIVNYADDFVICCRGSADEALIAMRRLMERLRLTVNESKTSVRRMPEESFEFLSYTIGRCYSTKTGRAYIGTRPSSKSVSRLCREISECTSRRWRFKDAAERVAVLNEKLRGWSGYFRLGPVSKAYAAVEQHVCGRLRRWLCKKHKVRGSGMKRYPDEYLHHRLGLIDLRATTRDLPWAKG